MHVPTIGTTNVQLNTSEPWIAHYTKRLLFA